MTATIPGKRPIKEPGGILLVTLGMVEADIEAAIWTLYPTASSLTILASKNAAALAKADEVWIYAPLGLRGFLALIRRISWRHFDAVYQPNQQPRWLKYLIWPNQIFEPAWLLVRLIYRIKMTPGNTPDKRQKAPQTKRRINPDFIGFGQRRRIF